MYFETVFLCKQRHQEQNLDQSQVSLSSSDDEVPIIPRDLDSRTTITINDQTFDIEADDLEAICVLGRGAYGVVEKMKHKQTGTIIAVKVGSYLIALGIFVKECALIPANPCVLSPGVSGTSF